MATTKKNIEKSFQLYRNLGGDLSLGEFRKEARKGLAGIAKPPQGIDLAFKVATHQPQSYSSYKTSVYLAQRMGFKTLKPISQKKWNLVKDSGYSVKSQFGNPEQREFLKRLFTEQDMVSWIEGSAAFRDSALIEELRALIRKIESEEKITQDEIDRAFELMKLIGITNSYFEGMSEDYRDE